MDDELEAIRKKRMQELQQQQGQDPQQKKAMEDQKEMMINSMLAQILDQSARARLNSIALVKPEKAKRIEAMLIQMAQSQQIPGKMNESQLVQVLEKISQQTQQQKTKVKFERRRVMDSDSDE